MANRIESLLRAVGDTVSPPDAAELSAAWPPISVEVLDAERGRTYRGRLDLLPRHWAVTDALSGAVVHSLALSAAFSVAVRYTVQPTGRSLAVVPRMRAAIDVETDDGPLVYTVAGEEGRHVARALEILFMAYHGLAARRDAELLRTVVPSDAVHALSMLPLDLECTMTQSGEATAMRATDRPVVLRIDEAFQVHILHRPQEIVAGAALHAVAYDLDDIILLSASGTTLQFRDHDNHAFAFSVGSDAVDALRHVEDLFLANATSVIRRHLQLEPGDALQRPFGVGSLRELLEQYCAVDTNLDGHIAESEFLVALGPVLGADEALPKALYSLFDTLRRDSIRFCEFVHGCHTLLRGSVTDRLRYIFGFFDTKRRESVNFHQFLDGLRTLSKAATIRMPPGRSLDAFAGELFARIDTDGSTFIDFAEFSRALTGDIGVIDALRSYAVTNTRSATHVVSFGHPRWHEITHILYGIQASVTAKVADPPPVGAAVPSSAFTAKAKYNLCASAIAPQSLFRTLSSGANDVWFKDYAPAAFAALRRHYGIDGDEYLASLGIEQLRSALVFGSLASLFEMTNSGRSGSFFYSTFDQKYVLKTIAPAEAATLQRMLPTYYEHLVKNPDSLLTRFTGLHALVRGGTKIYFVAMANMFLNKLPIHETFDLKGSSVNRSTPAEKRKPGIALKDNDFDQRRLYVSSPHKALLQKQAVADSLFLSGHNLNDYSFLLGVHTAPGHAPLGHSPPCPRPQHTSLQQYFGGIPSTSHAEVYFLGILDILTDYGLKKVGEHLGKSVLYDGSQVSCIPPRDYHDRFVKYLDTIVVAAVADAAASSEATTPRDTPLLMSAASWRSQPIPSPRLSMSGVVLSPDVPSAGGGSGATPDRATPASPPTAPRSGTMARGGVDPDEDGGAPEPLLPPPASPPHRAAPDDGPVPDLL